MSRESVRERLARTSYEFTLEYARTRYTGARLREALRQPLWHSALPVQKKFGYALADYMIEHVPELRGEKQ